MNKIKSVFSIYLTIGLMVFSFLAQTQAQTNRGGDREVRDIVKSLNSKIDDFRYNLDYELSRISISRDEQDEINGYIKELGNAVSQFEGKFTRRRESAQDVADILDAARNVNEFVSGKRFGSKSQSDWADVRNLLDRLAVKYNVGGSRNGNISVYPSNNPNNYPNNYPTTYSNSNGGALTGTYELDSSRSDNTGDIADRAIQNSNAQNNNNAREDLQNRLEAPSQIAIDVRGIQVTLASSKAAPITFAADGRDRAEKLGNGDTIRVRATFRGQELIVSSIGGETDYTVTFASIDNGKSLKVTRRITTDYLTQTVFAESVYNKSDAVARLGIDNGNNSNSGVYSSSDSNDYPTNYPTGNPNNYPRTSYPQNGNYIVPNGTILTGTLDNEISTKVSQNNDRFRMTVNAPDEYRGAVVEGYITGVNRSGKVSGRSQITFNFERIRLPNGQTYDFAGFLQSVTDTNGKTVKVDTEGSLKGGDQTKETVKRGGIGAGIGALIGAIAGGVKGAAIGAIIGGGAGAGSVVLTGKEDLELKQGSSISVQSSSPSR